MMIYFIMYANLKLWFFLH